MNCLKKLPSHNIKFVRYKLWIDRRRLQNPNIVKEMPTLEFVKKYGKLKKTKLIYVCGLGSTGSLGLEKFYKPDLKESDKPSNVWMPTFKRLGRFEATDKISDIACGYGFTIIAAQVRDSSHSALGFGLNSHTQIGYHAPRPGFPLEILATPAAIVLPTKTPIKKVSCGRAHSLLLNQQGQVFSMGDNSLGQCGRVIIENENYFGNEKVHYIEELPENISHIQCGQDHSFFLTDDGKLFACGWGADGQTGLGHYDNQSSPQLVKGDIEGAEIVKVSSYADTVLALDKDGNVFGWGNTEYAQFRTLANCHQEQFNTPRRLKLKIPGKIVDVAAGGTICALLNDQGQVFVWGFGILGKGPNVDQSSVPTLIPETLFGRNIHNPDAKIEKIYAGLGHFAAISNEGDLFTWGRNRGQCLGFAHKDNQFFPMRVNMNLAVVKKVSLGIDHTCAIVEKVC